MAFANHEYGIFPKNKLIIEHYSGMFDIRDLLSCKLQLSKDRDFSPNFHVLADFRRAEFEYKRTEKTVIAEFLQNNSCLIGQRKVIHLTKTPNQVIHSLIFKTAAESFPMDIEAVSTVETALNYMGLNSEENKWLVENILHEFAEELVLV